MVHAGFVIDRMKQDDWKGVRSIYEEGISTGLATFETRIPTYEEWNANHLENCRIVARNGLEIVGWAALSPVSKRKAYSGVAEVSVYVRRSNQGQHIGKSLLNALIKESEGNSIWTLQASIFPENLPSVRLHQSCGFRMIGKRERIGKLGDVWRDTLLFERRSEITGVS